MEAEVVQRHSSSFLSCAYALFWDVDSKKNLCILSYTHMSSEFDFYDLVAIGYSKYRNQLLKF